MAPGGTLFRFPPHFGENVLPHGSHEWLPYSKDEVRLKSVNSNLSFRQQIRNTPLSLVRDKGVQTSAVPLLFRQ